MEGGGYAPRREVGGCATDAETLQQEIKFDCQEITDWRDKIQTQRNKKSQWDTTRACRDWWDKIQNHQNKN